MSETKHTAGAMRAATEIARAISELCATQGGVVNTVAVAEKTAALIDRETGAPELVAACEKLIAYRDRCGPLNFQIEKADDFIFKMRVAVAKARGEHEGGAK